MCVCVCVWGGGGVYNCMYVGMRDAYSPRLSANDLVCMPAKTLIHREIHIALQIGYEPSRAESEIRIVIQTANELLR